ncbi:MAG TPA: dihydroorotate dehydrogenase electron transfer subunit [Actinomycetota bacterium]
MIRHKAEILSVKKAGIYSSVTLVAPEIADQARPGQFIEVGVPDDRAFQLRRPFSIHSASRRGGWSGTLEFAFAEVGPGTRWLSEIQAHDFLDIIGPLGKPFLIPRDLTNCLLVGGGYGAAPLYFLAEELRVRGKRVDMIIGARDQDRVFKPVEGKRMAVSITITTEDGSVGDRGRVTDVLPGMVSRCGSEMIYACGPNPMLRAVAEYATASRIPSQVAVEEMMACGMGVCWTCVVPVIRKDGSTWDNLRSCVEGPVFSGARVWWDRWLGGPSTTTPPHGVPLEAAAKGQAWQAE